MKAKLSKTNDKNVAMKKPCKKQSHAKYNFSEACDADVDELIKLVMKDMGRVWTKKPVKIPPLQRLKKFAEALNMSTSQARHLVRCIYDKSYESYYAGYALVNVRPQVTTSSKGVNSKGKRVKKTAVKKEKDEVVIKREPKSPRK